MKSVAFQVIRHNRLRDRVLTVLGRSMQKEMKRMCGLITPSILRSRDPQNVQSFKWQMLIEELKEKAPILFQVLASCAYKKPPKEGKKTYQVKDEVVVGICAAILLRHKSSKMNLVQRINSMILFSNHAGKMVWSTPKYTMYFSNACM